MNVFCLLLPGVHALDLAGPIQALYEAQGMGARYALRYVGSTPQIPTAQGFAIGEVEPLPPAPGRLGPGTRYGIRAAREAARPLRVAS